MSIDVRQLDREDSARWNDYVDRSPQAGVFHRFEALEAQATYSDATLYPLVGYVGEEPIGLFPVFGLRKALVSTAFSPPPDLRVPYLGPALLNMGKLKQRKAERRQRQFVEACLQVVDEVVAPRYVHVRADSEYGDLRPFLWNDFRARPSYTYVVDLTAGTDELLMAFSSDARSNIRTVDPERFDIVEGDVESVRTILAHVQRRFDAQNVAFDVPEAFVVDLYEDLPDGMVRPYVCTVDGAFAGGIVVTDDGRTVGRWQGGVRTDAVDLPVNDLLDWRVITDAIDRGRVAYDLVGADNERINRYKSKFAPDLRDFHSLERGSALFSMLAHGYKNLR